MSLPNRRALIRTATVLAAFVLAGCAAPTSMAPDIFASREPHAASRDEMWFVFLESGKTGFSERSALDMMQRGHIANFQRLFGEKKLLAAGPLNPVAPTSSWAMQPWAPFGALSQVATSAVTYQICFPPFWPPP